jgi:hypothetical protein
MIFLHFARQAHHLFTDMVGIKTTRGDDNELSVAAPFLYQKSRFHKQNKKKKKTRRACVRSVQKQSKPRAFRFLLPSYSPR